MTGDARPLSEAQSGLWFAQRLDPDNPIYNTGQLVEIHGALDVEAFRAAVDEALAESPALSIRVVEDQDGPKQMRAGSVRLSVSDLSHLSDALAEARRRMDADTKTPLDPTRDDLVAEHLFVLGTDHYAWYQRIHHLVIDGYGVNLLNKRIGDLYAHRVAGTPKSSALGSYEAVLAEEDAYRGSAKWVKDREFWRSEFADHPVVTSIARGVPVTARHYFRCCVPFPSSFGEALSRRAEESAVAWPDVLTALTAAFLQRHTGGDEVVAGVPTMNRLGSVSARVPAMVMNVLPGRIAIDEDTPLNEWLVTVAKKLRQIRRHGKYRSEQLRRDLGLLGGERRLHGPLINILPFEEKPALLNCETRLEILGTGAVDDLTFTMRANALATEIHLELDANPSLYTQEDTNDLAERYAVFLRAALEAETLAQVPTLTPEEHRRWSVTVNDTAHPVEEVTLTTLLERAMVEHAAAPALSFQGRTLLYSELDRATAAMATKLASQGVTRGDVVAVFAPRSLELVVALVGILRLGAAYLPLDIDHPRDRISVMLGSAKPAAVLTFAEHAARLPDAVEPLLLDEALQWEPKPLPAGPSLDDAAYVIYTSGSTGTPKGVVNEHRGIVNRLEWMRMHYGIQPDDRILQKTPATFDVSVWEFFLAFISGATLVVAPPESHKDPAWLARIFREERITTAHFVPSMLAAFLAEPSAEGIALRRVFCSGEELPARLRDRFHEVVKAELHNLYGPTEAAVDVTYWPATPQDKSASVPIGFPVWNTSMHVVDSRMRPLPPNVIGNLYIGGVQVARGYLGQPELTAERFLSDPFQKGVGRIYHTGDLAYRRRDGAIVFAGRSDHQVKIRGLRVELGEIEQAILSSGEVDQVVVIAREDRPGDQRLAAYLTPVSAGAEPNVSAIRKHLGALLPDYMAPSSFQVLPELPLSRNGKLNRAALPAPELSAEPAGRAPETPTEIWLANLFAEVLGVDRVGAEDDFFNLGGHSLLAARVMARVREHWQCELGLGVMFTNPTVARLAVALDDLDNQRPADEGLGPLIPLLRSSAALPALFCLHPAGGVSWCYAGLARMLDPMRPVYGVQARGLRENNLPQSMDEMAAEYVDELLRLQPEGPYHLLGWSVGGIVAHTMAVHLQERGRDVGVVAMLDAYPSDCWRAEAPADEAALLKALLHIAGHDPKTVTIAMTRESVIQFLRLSGHPLGALSDEALAAVMRVVASNNKLVRSHYHRVYRGTVLHFGAALDHQGRNLHATQWQPYVDGKIESIPVHSLHAHMTGPDASEHIAEVLKRYF